MLVDLEEIREWLTAGNAAAPGFDHAAFDRMADEIFSTLSSVGGHEAKYERAMLAIKVLAMVMAWQLPNASEEYVEAQCANVGRILAEEVRRFRSCTHHHIELKH